MSFGAQAISVGFLGILASSSCNDTCSGIYNCPNISTSISLPADISARVTSASGDTCTPTVDAPFAQVDIASTTKRPCHVSVQLDDGSVETSDVTFVELPCCGTTVRGTPLAPVDGGAGD
jgi:hypothetical protein